MLNIKEINPANDNINVSFSGKGIIHILDDEGNLILKTNNMIVKSGRELIYEACRGESFNLTEAKVVIGFDQSKTIVTEDTHYSNKSNKDINFVEDTILKSSTSENPTALTIEVDPELKNDEQNKQMLFVDTNNLCFKTSLIINNQYTDTTDINDSNVCKINWIGIVVNDNILFSKSLFNTIIIPPNRSIIINYNVYF